MYGAVSELIRRNQVPQVDDLRGGQQLAIGVVGPAGVKEVVAHVAVDATADEDRLVDDDQWYAAHHPSARFQQVECQVVRRQRLRLETLPGHVPAKVLAKVLHMRLVELRVALVDARDTPRRA